VVAAGQGDGLAFQDFFDPRVNAFVNVKFDTYDFVFGRQIYSSEFIGKKN